MDFVSARNNMVDSQVRTSDVTDPSLQAAMRAVPRERLVGPKDTALAYAEREAEIAPGRSLLKPRDAAKLLQALGPRPGERALVICEPWVAAVLARMGVQATLLDTPAVIGVAGLALEEEGVRLLAGDPAAPKTTEAFDLLFAGGSVADVPTAWTDRLVEGGRAGVILRRGRVGRATVLTKAAAVGGLPVFEVFPPYLPGLEPKETFAF